VVTGIGMITALGHDAKTSFDNIVKGECGIDEIKLFDASRLAARIAGEVKDFDPATVMDPKEVKKS